MSKYFIYVRKSTDVEDKQVRSVEDQLSVLRQLARDESLEIAEEFVEKQSAKIPGRPIFNEMLSKLQRGDVQGIICWKLDRLARNPVDGGQISWLLQQGIIQHIWTNERSYYPSDNVIMMSVEFGMANQFILDLSSNTKRGLYEKVKRGEYPSHAPVGYLNDRNTKKVVVDKKVAKKVIQAFELYSKNYSRLEDIANYLASFGITTEGGNPLKKDQISFMLANPFYIGLFRYNGEIYEGNHESIIPKQLFDKVQKVLKNRGRPRKSKNTPQPLCGLIRCGECSRMVTSETHVKKSGLVFRYYRCTKKKTNCSQSFVREADLTSQLTCLVKDYSMPESWADKLFAMLEQDREQSNQINSGYLQGFRSDLQVTEQKLKRLLEVYLAEDIEQENYRYEKAQLLSGKKSLTDQISRLEGTSLVWLEPMQNFIKDAVNTQKISLSSSLLELKSAAQKIFGSNLVLKDKIVSGTPLKLWELLYSFKQKAGTNPASCDLARELGFEPRTDRLHIILKFLLGVDYIIIHIMDARRFDLFKSTPCG